MTTMTNRSEFVGPILQPGATANAVIAAIQQDNVGVEVTDRGGYLRVSVLGRCVVSRQAIESQLGRAFVLPGDLEQLMPSFQGRLAISEDRVEWTAPQRLAKKSSPAKPRQDEHA